MTWLLARTSGYFFRLAVLLFVDHLLFLWSCRCWDRLCLSFGCCVCCLQFLFVYRSYLHRYALYRSYFRLCALHLGIDSTKGQAESYICFVFSSFCLNFIADFTTSAWQESLLWLQYLHCTTDTRGMSIGTLGWSTGTYRCITR